MQINSVLIFFLTLGFAPLAVAAPEKAKIPPPPATPALKEAASSEKTISDLSRLLEKARVPTRNNFREELAVSTTEEPVPVKSIPPAPTEPNP